VYGVHWANFEAGSVFTFLAFFVIYLVFYFYFPYGLVYFFDGYRDFISPSSGMVSML